MSTFPPNIDEEYTQITADAGIFTLAQHVLLRINGADAERYLQGRLTQDIRGLSQGQGVASLLLTPQGRIQGKCVVVRGADDYVIIADPGDGEEAFVKALLQFRVADRVEAHSLSASHTLLSVQGAKAQEALNRAGLGVTTTALHQYSSAHIGGILIHAISAHRGPFPAIDLIVPTYAVTQVVDAIVHASPEVHVLRGSEGCRNALRIRAGVPEAGIDLNEKVVATEIDISGLISFKKGCYAGQEVVEMSTARGRPNRRLAHYSVSTRVAEGAAVTTSADAVCGTVSSSCMIGGKSYLLAFIKSSTSETEELRIDGVTLEIVSER